VTWGIGYDGGHQTRSVIGDDWAAHRHRDRLVETAGITGKRAKAILPGFRGIETAYEYASQVFEDRSLVEYMRRTERAFGRDDFRRLTPNACAALTSLVYNRGAAMAGDSRREMRAIRSECVPKQDNACIAKEIRAMTRLWRGTVNEKGLSARREAEASLAETPQEVL
jgi:GH24 family phage-related lysozyme (muramidase)